jgi:DAACS family dicarboxylate/amino acid:cation (Na+ or H+) symporter
MSLSTKVVIGLILGIGLGLVVNMLRVDIDAAVTRLVGYDAEIVAPVLRYVMDPLGRIFLNMLLMTVVPLVFASLAVGVAQLGDLRQLGRIGAKTFFFFAVTMTMAVAIGLVLVNLFEPGVAMPQGVRDSLLAEGAKEAKEKTATPPAFGINTFVNIVPRNPFQSAVNLDMLGIIFFALMVGIALTMIHQERSNQVVSLLHAIGDVMVVIINFAMLLAPYAVFALIFSKTADFGLQYLKPLAGYVLIVLAGLAIQMFGVLSLLVRVLAGMSPIVFFRKVRNVILTAFSTSSSNATLPTSIRTAEDELGVPPKIAGFVVPLGATMNMNGTALFEGVTAVFLAQVFFGHSPDLGTQLIVIVLSVLTAIGAAGVPGGSLPLLVLVIAAAGVPGEFIAIILGVDRLLDMCRTTLNVVGDLAAAAFVAKSEGYALKE